MSNWHFPFYNFDLPFIFLRLNKRVSLSFSSYICGLSPQLPWWPLLHSQAPVRYSPVCWRAPNWIRYSQVLNRGEQILSLDLLAAFLLVQPKMWLVEVVLLSYCFIMLVFPPSSSFPPPPSFGYFSKRSSYYFLYQTLTLPWCLCNYIIYARWELNCWAWGDGCGPCGAEGIGKSRKSSVCETLNHYIGSWKLGPLLFPTFAQFWALPSNRKRSEEEQFWYVAEELVWGGEVQILWKLRIFWNRACFLKKGLT